MALENDFLLNGLFALSAFEMARLTKNDYEQYVNAALEYHTVALGSFRSQLPKVTSERHEAALCLSLMLMVFALASAHLSPNHHGRSKVAWSRRQLLCLSWCVDVFQLRRVRKVIWPITRTSAD